MMRTATACCHLQVQQTAFLFARTSVFVRSHPFCFACMILSLPFASAAEFLEYYNNFVARHRSQCEELYDIQRDAVLGKGAFGVVVSGTRLDTQQSVAAKLLAKSRLGKSKEALRLLHNEIAVWESLDHPNLVKLMDVFEEPSSLILITEILPGGDLLRRLQAEPEGRFSEPVASRLSSQLVSAVAYLHAHEVVHCDLKPSNVLVVEVAGECDIAEITIKVADFGLSQSIKRGHRKPDGKDGGGGGGAGGDESGGAGSGAGGGEGGGEEDGGESDMAEASLNMVCGTPIYFAPELVRLAQQHIDASDYGPAVDDCEPQTWLPNSTLPPILPQSLIPKVCFLVRRQGRWGA